MIPATEQRLRSFLLASLLLHLLVLLMLDKPLLWTGVRSAREFPTISLILELVPAQKPRPDTGSGVATRPIRPPDSVVSGTKKATIGEHKHPSTSAQPPADQAEQNKAPRYRPNVREPRSGPADAEGHPGSNPSVPALDLSKIVEDAYQIANKLGADSDKLNEFHRRNAKVNSENLKAPSGTEPDSIESYKTADAAYRVCVPTFGDKKRCMRLKPPDSRNPHDPGEIYQFHLLEW